MFVKISHCCIEDLALDKDTLIKIAVGFVGVVGAIVVALLGLYSQLRIKRLELRAEERRDQAARRLAFHIPLLRLCYELDGRIGRILSNLGTDWLQSSYLEKIHTGEGFARDPREKGYFIMSSVYVFACFFGWTEAIKQGVDATRAMASNEGSWNTRLLKVLRIVKAEGTGRVFIFDHDISVVRRLFQYEELFCTYSLSKKLVSPTDACKLHRHFQHSIGEMMLHRENDAVRCKTFREFYEAYSSDARYRYWFIPLEQLFTDLSGFQPDKDTETQAELKNDIRPLRLLAIRYWCRVLMQNLGREVGIETPTPEDVLNGRSEALRTAIRTVKIEDLEAHLLTR